MKARNFFLFMLVVMLASGLTFVSCDSSGDTGGGSSGPATLANFQGRWVLLSALEQGWREYYVEFTGTNVLLRAITPNGDLTNMPGTFTFTNTHITFVAPPGEWPGWTTPYTLSGNTLRLHEGDDWGWFEGTFTRQPEPVFVPANPARGFNYGYYYYIPGSVRNSSRTYILVETISTGGFTNFSINDSRTFETIAYNSINNARDLANELGVVVLVPAIPRPWTAPPNIDPQILNRAAMQATGTHARADLQVIKMMDDLRQICRGRGINLHSKILLNGFSAPGNFGNRFAAIHPALVQAVASGGVAGMPILPVDTLLGERLIYPVGIADLRDIAGHNFNFSQYRTIPQFIYMGSQDSNDPLGDTSLFHGEEERRLTSIVLGTNILTRFERAKAIHEDLGTNATFRVYQGVGHTVTAEMRRDVIEFFRRYM